jgi:hypothetical protein
MDFMLNFEPAKPDSLVNYRDRILLTGSCFTEHIGTALQRAKFTVLQNPNGILFDPVSVSRSLISYVHDQRYDESDLFQLNEVWQSWQHHSRFSDMDKDKTLEKINQSQQEAHQFLKDADWLIITLGSSFSYRLTDGAALYRPELTSSLPGDSGVANCHRAPAQWFNKHLLSINEIIESLDLCLHQLMQFNPKLRILFTISPVRHIRDGVVENNRSKARLIEAVHHMVNKFDKLYYFPAYEIVIDVLRDYRFYDVDLVHPNYLATEFVMKKFMTTCFDEETQTLVAELKKINIARHHKPFQPASKAHQQFLHASAEKVKDIQSKYPMVDLREELAYFTGSTSSTDTR